MISYWEKTQFLKYDLIVVGGGIVGLFTALEFLNNHPNSKIAVFDKGVFPDGASTKNAGFACFGSLSELVEDSFLLNDKELLELVKKRVTGLELLRKTLGDKTIDFHQHGGNELYFSSSEKLVDQINRFNKLLKPIFKKQVFFFKNNFIENFGFSKQHIESLIHCPFEGQINTGKTIYSLQNKVRELGGTLYTNTNVDKIITRGKRNRVIVKNNQNEIHFESKFLAICTNAFAKKWFPKEDINPGRGMVLITKPIKDLKIKGCFHYDKGFNYFRNINQRIMIGGGRNIDFQKEETTQHGINSKIKKKLINDLENFIIPNQKFQIDMEWSGIMAFGKTKMPIVKSISEGVAIGVRIGGMGMAIGSIVGKKTYEHLNT